PQWPPWPHRVAGSSRRPSTHHSRLEADTGESSHAHRHSPDVHSAGLRVRWGRATSHPRPLYMDRMISPFRAPRLPSRLTLGSPHAHPDLALSVRRTPPLRVVCI